MTDCTLEQKTITVIYDSNIDGAYTVDLNHGGIYNGKPLWCSTSKSFNANSKCGSENNLSIPDTSIILILPIIIIIIAILLQKEKRPLKKKKIVKEKKEI